MRWGLVPACEPIECITPHGIKTRKGAHEFDILIYATGFDGHNEDKAAPHKMKLPPRRAGRLGASALLRYVPQKVREPLACVALEELALSRILRGGPNRPYAAN
jgi:hypothetical protein